MHLLHVGQESILVVQPVPGQGGCRGMLAAAQLQGDLHGVGVHVVEILENILMNKEGLKTLVSTCIPPGTSYQAAPLVIPPGKLSAAVQRIFLCISL